MDNIFEKILNPVLEKWIHSIARLKYQIKYEKKCNAEIVWNEQL